MQVTIHNLHTSLAACEKECFLAFAKRDDATATQIHASNIRLASIRVTSLCEVAIDSNETINITAQTDLSYLQQLQGLWRMLATKTSMQLSPNMSQATQAHQQLPRQAYEELLAAQRFDGSFSWPNAFLRHVQAGARLASDAPAVLVETVGLDMASTAVAAAALPRFFMEFQGRWALVQAKALAWLQRHLPDWQEFFDLSLTPNDVSSLAAHLVLERLQTHEGLHELN